MKTAKVEDIMTGLTIILNGERDFEDPTERLYKHLRKHERQVTLVDELFDKPQRLRTITDLKPQNLVILTTGMRGPQVNELTDRFMELGFLPENIIFVLGNTVDFFYSFIRELKGKTHFWELGLADMELWDLEG